LLIQEVKRVIQEVKRVWMFLLGGARLPSLPANGIPPFLTHAMIVD
jgi:hypothetical protein